MEEVLLENYVEAGPYSQRPVFKTGKCLTTTGKIKLKDGFFFLQDEIFFIIKLFELSYCL